MKRKKIKERGKIRLSEYFKELKVGDSVSVVREKSVSASFPKKIQGRTGKVLKKNGRRYFIQIEKKKFLIEPVHLKKIK